MAEDWNLPTGDLMKGKRGIVMGVANQNSIAWGISKQLAAQGAEIAFTYQGEALERRVRPLVESIGMDLMIPADVTDDASMDAAFAEIKAKWGKIDFLVHSIAFAGKDELQGSMVANTTREGFRRAMDISVYSFIDCARRGAELMPDGGSIMCMTYLGAERTVPSYNVMALPRRRLRHRRAMRRVTSGRRASASTRFRQARCARCRLRVSGGGKSLMGTGRDWSLLKEDTSMEGVAGCALYLLSPLGRSIAGEVIHVDAGFHVVGVPDLQEE